MRTIKKSRVAAILLALLMLSSCARTEPAPTETEESTTAPATETRYQWETKEEQIDEGILFRTDKLYANFEGVLNPSEKEAYASLIETLRAGGDRCPMEQETFARISGFAAFSPYYALVKSLVYEDGNAVVTYHPDIEAPVAYVAEFDTEMRSLLSRSGVFDTGNRTDEAVALSLYRFVATECTFRFGENESLMTCMRTGSYTEVAFNVLYAQLLLQADIPTVLATDADGHIWVAAQLGGAWYHFDPAGEYFASTGFGLSRFGMTDARRECDGIAGTFTALVPSYWQEAEHTATAADGADSTAASSDPVEDADSAPVTTASDPAVDAAPDTTAPEDPVGAAEPALRYAFVLICDDPRYDAFADCNNWSFDEDNRSLYLLPMQSIFALRLYETE